MPPRLPKLPNPIQPLRDIIRGGREQLEQARDDIRSLAGDLRITEPPGETKSLGIKEGAEKGTSCLVCAKEHFREVYKSVSGALNEAMRFARGEGIRSPEVMRRLRHAGEELNTMERFDLSPQEIVKLPDIEKSLARWAVEQSRELRHIINAIRSADDLEKVAAKASDVADNFEEKMLVLEKHYEGEIHPDIIDLKQWLEERKKRGY